MRERIVWIDNLKGILMLLVILGHSYVSDDLYKVIYTFHMAAFFAVSGYLFKRTEFKVFFWKKFNSLIVPYFIFAILSFPFGMILPSSLKGSKNLVENIYNLFYLKGSVGWNASLWFLVCLFFVEIIFYFFKNKSNNNYLILIISIIIGYVLYTNKIVFPFGIHTAFYVLPFYIIGNWLAEYAIMEKIKSISTMNVKIMLVGLLMINVLFGMILNPYKIEIYKGEFGNYFYYIMAGISGILFIFMLLQYIPTNKIFSLFGRNTLFVMGTHMYIIIFLKVMDKLFLNSVFFNRYNWSGSLIFLIVSICYYIFLTIAEKHNITKKYIVL